MRSRGDDDDGEPRRWVLSWPWTVFCLGVACAAAAYGSGAYVDDRIVLLGPVDAARVVAALWAIAVLAVGVSIVLGLQGAFAGPVSELVIPLTQTIVVLATFAVAIAAYGITQVVLLQEPAYRLRTPGSSSAYIVTTFTFGETTATLWKGDGRVFERAPTDMPAVDRDTDFADAHRIEEGAHGTA